MLPFHAVILNCKTESSVRHFIWSSEMYGFMIKAQLVFPDPKGILKYQKEIVVTDNGMDLQWCVLNHLALPETI